MELSEFNSLAGTVIGVSDWRAITQEMISQFAELTGDKQFIHTDPAAAALTPLGGTIAHGFLTLSLLAPLAQACLPRIENTAMGLNYGFGKLRFLTPVRAGRRIRAHFTLLGSEARRPGEVLNRFSVEVEIEAEETPALVAEWLTLVLMA